MSVDGCKPKVWLDAPHLNPLLYRETLLIFQMYSAENNRVVSELYDAIKEGGS